MEAWVWIVIGLIVVVLVVAVVAAYVVRQQRRRADLRETFGKEYERAVAREGDVRRGESDLIARRERREKLDIRPLSPSSRDAYARTWEQTQARFVDDPADALRQADTLIIAVMQERGYPMDDFEQRADDISVDHPDVVQHYRSAHDVSTRVDDHRDVSTVSSESNVSSVSTEDMRQGFVHYRALFEQLLESDGSERQAIG
jgi:hypothetical protein